MDFEEWFKKRHTKTGLYEKSMCGDDDSLYLKHEMKKAFEAGQQSKHAEIDALKAKINEAKEEINSFFDNQTQKPTDREYCNKLADIMELLK